MNHLCGCVVGQRRERKKILRKKNAPNKSRFYSKPPRWFTCKTAGRRRTIHPHRRGAKIAFARVHACAHMHTSKLANERKRKKKGVTNKKKRISPNPSKALLCARAYLNFCRPTHDDENGAILSSLKCVCVYTFRAKAVSSFVKSFFIKWQKEEYFFHISSSEKIEQTTEQNPLCCVAKKRNNNGEEALRRAEEEEEKGERRGCEGYGAVEARADEVVDGVGVASQGCFCLACDFGIE